MSEFRIHALSLGLLAAVLTPSLAAASVPTGSVELVVTGTVTSEDNDFEATSPNTDFGLGSTVTYTVVLDNTGVLPNPGGTTRYYESIVSWSVSFGSYEIGGGTGDIFIRDQGIDDQFSIAHNDSRANMQFHGRDRDDFDTGGGPLAGVPFTGFDFGTTTGGLNFIDEGDSPFDVFNAIAADPTVLEGSVMRLLFDQTLLDGVVEVFGIARVDSVSASIVPAPASGALLLAASGTFARRRRRTPGA